MVLVPEGKYLSARGQDENPCCRCNTFPEHRGCWATPWIFCLLTFAESWTDHGPDLARSKFSQCRYLLRGQSPLYVGTPVTLFNCRTNKGILADCPRFLTLTSPRLTAVCNQSKDTEFSQRKWNVFGAGHLLSQTRPSAGGFRVRSVGCLQCDRQITFFQQHSFTFLTFSGFYMVAKELNTLQPKENSHKWMKLWHVSSSVDNTSTTKKGNEMQAQVKHKLCSR